ncbi:baseplate J/gp47 family protein [Propioniciclava sinopodophylli]|uniref:baseplate J/gp47 family protein n=1 Tax=Propioniciclava sinopodophylli TaxID=1837344 RepID=UPI00249013A8|nr:baseplate J/gp47 family protein [Propioniciclava sinopodophylli]
MSLPDRRARVADVPAALLAAINRDDRRALVAGSTPPDPTGIDFVEVVPMALTMQVLGRVRPPRWRTLLVHLLRGPVPAAWDATRVEVVGGVRADPALNPVGVAWAVPALAITGPVGGPVPSLPPGVTPADRVLVQAVVDEDRRDRVLVVRTTTWGDLSGYVLRVLAVDRESLPDYLDPPLAQDRFSFAIECEAPLDCKRPAPDAPAAGPQPVLDYLARDWPALRRRLLDRFSSQVPAWTDQSSADIGVTLIELMAHLGDLYAYRQDAAAVEAYLTTARMRTSVRRHARLLGYPMGDGCSARTWLALTTAAAATLPRRSGVCDGGVVPAPPGQRRTPLEAVDAGATVFETTRALQLLPARNEIPLHTWGDRSHTLPACATAAFLAVPVGDDPQLRAGDVLVLAELPPGGAGPAANGDPGHRQAVRLSRDPVVVPDAYAPGTTVLEIRWAPEDALTAPLVVSEAGPDGRPVSRAVALANVVLADAGATVLDEPLAQVTDGGSYDRAPRAPYRPRLDRTGVAFVDAVDPLAGPTAGASGAGAALATDPADARAAVTLDDGRRTWSVRRDLIASSGLDAHLVVEVDDAGVAWLRFGDGASGRRPALGTLFRASYRLGSGASGNVAPGTLTEPLLRPDGTAAFVAGVEVWNPLSARGGHDPEPVRAVQQLAPQWFRRQERAVTTDDHRVVAEDVDGVQRAVARRRWTGSWHAVEVLVDTVASRVGDDEVPRAVLADLETHRMAATDVEVRRPLWVPVHVRLDGCVLPGHLAGRVAGQVRDLLSAGVLPDGRRGMFHPDNLSFGEPLRLSDIVGTAMTVPGIAWIEVTRLGRLGGTDSASNIAAGQLVVGPREVIRCDSDPNLPEFGRVEIVLGGGS